MRRFRKAGNSIAKRLFWRAHLDEAIEQIARIRPQLAAPNAEIVSIDLPGGGFGGGFSERSIPFCQEVKKRYRHDEFVDTDPTQRTIGIGAAYI